MAEMMSILGDMNQTQDNHEETKMKRLLENTKGPVFRNGKLQVERGNKHHTLKRVLIELGYHTEDADGYMYKWVCKGGERGARLFRGRWYDIWEWLKDGNLIDIVDEPTKRF